MLPDLNQPQGMMAASHVKISSVNVIEPYSLHTSGIRFELYVRYSGSFNHRKFTSKDTPRNQ